MPDLLANIRGEIDTRIHELRPLVTEYERLLTDTTDRQTTPDAPAPSPPATTSVQARPEPAIPVAAAPVAVNPGDARTQAERHAGTSRTMTRLAPNRLHRPRRALLRPAFPKASRRG